MTNVHNEYSPDFVSPPGETLLETLEVNGISQAELAVRMGRPKKTINEIIKGKTAITLETALQLELALGIPSSFWSERERRFREALARVEQDELLGEWTEWLEKVPLRELISRRWIEKRSDQIEMLREVLRFFGVVSPKQWEILWGKKMGVSFRRSEAYSSDQVAIAAWLRKSEVEAQQIHCDPFDESGFRKALQKIRDLTEKPPTPDLYQEELVELCRQVGVAVTILRRLSKASVFGASQWLTPRKALVSLSLYYKSDDQFWFSFFHEAAHILLHSKKEVFIDEENTEDPASEDEIKANQFAADLLIPPDKLQRFVDKQPMARTGKPFFADYEICAFAQEIGVAPSIVVGRLQHDGLLQRQFNNHLRAFLKWSDGEGIAIRQRAQTKTD